MSDLRNSARSRLIVALDVATLAEARALVHRLGKSCGFYKIGLELAMSGGLEFVTELKAGGNRVFLDMKLLDIARTVERATANAARIGADFLTVHGHDLQTLRAAVAGRAASSLKLLAVTVLTSLTSDDLKQQGIGMEPVDLVLHRCHLAREAGFDGVVASGHEASRVRQIFGEDLRIVTPGIRPAGSSTDDQARIVTPGRAIAAGADYLVVGRPIVQAGDPKAAAESVVREIELAAAQRSGQIAGIP